MINIFLIFLNLCFAQSAVENRVNEHLMDTSKKMEIQGQQREVNLEKASPDYLEYNPPVQKQQPFVVDPVKQPADTSIYRDQYDHPTAYDPGQQVQEEVQYQHEQRDLAAEAQKSREEYIRQFQENAAKAGVKVEVDPKTLKVKASK
jgi:hypothetical protein